MTDAPGGATLTVRLVPRAGRSEIAGVRGGALLVRVAAAPVEGAANDALVALLAERLKLPRRRVTILSGERGRTKRLLVAGLTAAALQSRLAPLVGRAAPHA